MPYIRAIYVHFSETPHSIDGSMHVITYENMHSKSEDRTTTLNFYRPASGLKDGEWLKDMLVQVIEQL